jgi:hypothetical protein
MTDAEFDPFADRPLLKCFGCGKSQLEAGGTVSRESEARRVFLCWACGEGLKAHERRAAFAKAFEALP